LDSGCQHIATILIHLHRIRKGSAISLVEDRFFPTADLMVVMSGVLRFFLKFLVNTKIRFPLLLDPAPWYMHGKKKRYNLSTVSEVLPLSCLPSARP
jgi:hypothetical protein